MLQGGEMVAGKPEFKEIVVKAWNTQCDRGAFFFRYMSEED
jgi:hypothetical protein